MIDPLLSVEDVSVRFGGVVALDRVSFTMGRGEICGLIGPNGAGKTTLFNCLSRLYDVTLGRIRFDGGSLLARPRHGIAALGIGRTFQNLALFPSMRFSRTSCSVAIRARAAASSPMRSVSISSLARSTYWSATRGN